MARRKQPVIPDALVDQLLGGADARSAFDKDGLLDELKKALAEQALNAEIDHHLEAGEGDGNQPQHGISDSLVSRNRPAPPKHPAQPRIASELNANRDKTTMYVRAGQPLGMLRLL